MNWVHGQFTFWPKPRPFHREPADSSPSSKGNKCKGDTCIVRKNKLRHAINRLQIERFARSRGQKTFVFPVRHARRRKARRWSDLDIDKLLEVQDSSDVKAPGLLLYTQDMPIAVLSNISTRLGIVNGALGRATGIVLDKDGVFYVLKWEAIPTADSQILSHGLAPADLCIVSSDCEEEPLIMYPTMYTLTVHRDGTPVL